MLFPLALTFPQHRGGAVGGAVDRVQRVAPCVDVVGRVGQQRMQLFEIG